MSHPPRFLRVLLVPLVLLAACEPDRLPEERALLDSQDADERARAAIEVARNPDIPADRVAAGLSTALERELAEPTDGPVPAGSWFSASEIAAWNYASAAGLRGPELVPGLRERAENSDGPLSEWLLLARAYAGDQEAADGLVRLLGSRSPAVRAQAARLLGELGHRPAIGALEDLLSDPFRAPPPLDLPGGSDSYPVRDAAADALRALGVEVWPVAGELGAYEVVRP